MIYAVEEWRWRSKNGLGIRYPSSGGVRWAKAVVGADEPELTLSPGRIDSCQDGGVQFCHRLNPAHPTSTPHQRTPLREG